MLEKAAEHYKSRSDGFEVSKLGFNALQYFHVHYTVLHEENKAAYQKMGEL